MVGAWVVIVGNAVAGAWALGAHWIPRLRTPALWWLTLLVEVAIFLQVGFGVAMITAESRDADQFHMFYGFVAIITVAILYSYRTQLERHRYLLYGGGGLFLMGLGIRALLLDA